MIMYIYFREEFLIITLAVLDIFEKTSSFFSNIGIKLEKSDITRVRKFLPMLSPSFNLDTFQQSPIFFREKNSREYLFSSFSSKMMTLNVEKSCRTNIIAVS